MNRQAAHPPNMSTGVQLDRWCRRHGVVGYRGAFCADGMPTPWRPRDQCFIINHSRCGFGDGTHWLACRLKTDHTGCVAKWWDSYGEPPKAQEEQMVMTPRMKPPDFAAWFEACGVDRVEYWPTNVQSVASEVCGLYAAWFCKNGYPEPGNKAWSWLGTNYSANDAQIARLVKLQSDSARAVGGSGAAPGSLPRGGR